MTNDTNSGSKSADEVQREVRQSRAEVEDALEAIQDRLSPSQMFDQAVNYLRGSGGNEFMRNLGATVRDNPVPVALLGTGLAWLMLSRARPRRPYDQDEVRPGGYDADYYGAGDYPEDDDGFGDRPFGSEAAARADPGLAPDEGFVERAKETAAAVGATAQGLTEGAAEPGRDWATGARESAQEWSAGARATAVHARARVRRLGAGARERLGDTGDYLRDSARGAQARAGYYGRRMRRGFFDTLHEQPLVLGAVGLAVGAAIGAALPATETEDEWMGDTRDRLKDNASEAGRELLAKAGAAAGAAYDAAREEADRQGLTPEMAVVAEAASDAANTEAQHQKLVQTDDKPV